jgi:hypothetical protein
LKNSLFLEKGWLCLNLFVQKLTEQQIIAQAAAPTARTKNTMKKVRISCSTFYFLTTFLLICIRMDTNYDNKIK